MRTLSLLLLCYMALFHASGQPGSLDSTFGKNGIQTNAFLNNANTLNEEGRAVLTNANGDIFVVVNNSESGINISYTRIAKYLPDGRLDSSYGNAGYSHVANLGCTSAVMQGDKIIAAGYVYHGFGFALVRYTADGTLDASFGVNGIVTTPFGEANAIALQGDKIVVAGLSSDDYPNIDFALARYTTDGILDSSFGENGKVTTDFNNSNDGATSIVMQVDKIIAIGYSNSDFALARFLANGTLDSSFGENGRVTTDFNNSVDEAHSVVLQVDKIIVAGSTYNSVAGNSDFALARYTADGALDASFGENGKVTTDFNNSNDGATSIAMQGDKIIAAGQTYNSVAGNNDFALARYTANGTLDSSFGVDGLVTNNFNGNDGVANAIALQGDKITLAGSIYNSANGTDDFALARYTADGVLDASFGEQGLLTGYFPISEGNFTSTVIQEDKIIAAVNTGDDLFSPHDFALVRYTADGVLDSSFGVNGLVLTDFNNSSYDVANAIVLQGDKIIAAGGSNADFALARYTADGRLDSSFGENGKVTTDFNNSNDGARAIALQGDKIIVAGNTYNSVAGNYDFALARYTKDGALDASFGVNGKVTTDFYSDFYSDDEASSIAVQGDKIIVAGYAIVPFGNTDFALARYTADGALDATFGVNGQVKTDFNNSSDQVTSIAVQGDKIIAAGSTYHYENGNDYVSDFALARYTADGSLDTSFGVNGKQITDFFFSNDYANALSLQGDKIIAAGGSNADFALARYTADGALDSSFGENGKVTTYLGGSSSIQDIALYGNRLYTVGSQTFGQVENYGAIAAYQLEATGPAISISDVTVCESQKQAVVTIHLSAPSTQVVQVHYQSHPITAHSVQDYYSVGWTLQFAPGCTTATVKIPIVDDSICEPTEQFELRLTNPQHATIKDSIGIITIVDDDCSLTAHASTALQGSTSLSIAASPNPFADGFTVQLHSSDLKQPVNIRVYDVSGRLLEQREHLSIGQSLRLGDQYKAGTYVIEAVQGSQRVQTKVIKTGK